MPIDQLYSIQVSVNFTAPLWGLGAPEEAVALTAELQLDYLVFFLQICLCRIPKQDLYKVVLMAVDLSEVCGSRSMNSGSVNATVKPFRTTASVLGAVLH